MKEIEILLVEDNEGDVVLTLDTFQDLMLSNKINVVKDGEEAIRYLNKQQGFELVQTPDLIFLDINLPKIDGKEVLEYINSQPQLRSIPVVVLTTSSSQQDMDDCYNYKASNYIIKPLDNVTLLKVLSDLKKFRLSLVAIA